MAKPAKNETPYTAAKILDYMKKNMSYSPDTGEFRWTVDINAKTKANCIAGSINDRGYRTICVDRSVRRAHRLAWLWMTGEWPEADVDHINGNRDDNRWCNLRGATRTQNNGNSKLRPSNTSSMKGVTFNKRRGTWFARVTANGITRHLGTFTSPEAAKAAYDAAANENFKEYARSA